jgi:cytochrome P450
MSDQASTIPETFGFDPFLDPNFLLHPYPFYERIRQESPVARTSRGWIAVNYDDCRRLLMSESTRQADPTEWRPKADIDGLDELQSTVREWIGMSKNRTTSAAVASATRPSPHAA